MHAQKIIFFSLVLTTMECIFITYKMSTIKHFSIIFITLTYTVFEMTDPNKNYFNSIHFIHNGIFKIILMQQL